MSGLVFPAVGHVGTDISVSVDTASLSSPEEAIGAGRREREGGEGAREAGMTH